MSLGNRTDSEASAAAQDEEEWASRAGADAEGHAHAVLTSAEVLNAEVAAPPASSNGEVSRRAELQDDELPHARAGELAVLGDACPICLQTLADPVMLRVCYHVYCFECLSTWVHSLALHGVEPATCPLCKAAFQSVYANVRSETDFEIFHFPGRQQGDDSGAVTQQREHSASHRQRLRRRSLVYRRRMQLVRVGGVDVSKAEQAHAFPKMVKLKGEYESWLERELQACIGREIDLTVLLAIIDCCLNKITQCGAKKCYDEMQQALSPFLYEDAARFVRELACFLGSRLNLEAYDAAVEYRCSNAAECKNALCCSQL